MSSKTKRPRQQQQQQQQQQQHQEDMDEGGGEWTENDIIRCICGDDEEDGLMIQCNHCLAWIHCGCVNISRNKIPDRYKCDYCKKSKRSHVSTTKKADSKDFTKRVSDKPFKAITKSIVDNSAVKGKYRNMRKLWQQYQTSKETLKPSEQAYMASYPTMESSELVGPFIPKVSVKPLQRFMRGASFSSQRNPSIQKGIFADEHIQENRFLMEVMGTVLEKAQYRADESNHHSTLLTTLPHVFFHRTLDLCVDARHHGNDARFVRRACHPNAELKTIIVPNQDETEFVHLGIYTSKQVSRGEEITIPWHWVKLNKLKADFHKHKSIELDDDLKSVIKKMLAIFKVECGECACEDKDECFIEFLKDQVEPSSAMNKILACTDSTDEETPRECEHRPSVPPSPADSAEDSGTTNRYGIEEHKLPMKKRWLQRYLREKSLQF